MDKVWYQKHWVQYFSGSHTKVITSGVRWFHNMDNPRTQWLRRPQNFLRSCSHCRRVGTTGNQDTSMFSWWGWRLAGKGGGAHLTSVYFRRAEQLQIGILILSPNKRQLSSTEPHWRDWNTPFGIQRHMCVPGLVHATNSKRGVLK